MNANISKMLSHDSTMARLVKRYGPVPERKRPVFGALIRAVVSQMLSGSAAAAILGRIEKRVGFDPGKLSRVRTSTLRGLGLSNSKAECTRRLAKLALQGEFDDLAALSDDEILTRLTAIKGIGPWTAQMVLLGALGRPDVWPVGDGGVQRAARNLYGVELDELEELGERFRPYRSYASWYFWQSLDMK
jgi:DNA-3-methyladenine glycosylase II